MYWTPHLIDSRDLCIESIRTKAFIWIFDSANQNIRKQITQPIRLIEITKSSLATITIIILIPKIFVSIRLDKYKILTTLL